MYTLIAMRIEPKWAKEKQLFMLLGEDVLRQKALQSIFEVAQVKPGDLDLEIVIAGEKAPVDWVGLASTAPLWGERRVVVVRHLLRATPPEEKSQGIRAELANLPDYALLILVADEESGDEARQKRLQTVSKNWAKLVQSVGGVVHESKTNPKELRNFLREEAKAREKSLSPTGADLLAEMSGNQLSHALGELEKLILYVGNGADIQESHIREVTVPQRDWNVFAMIDAVVAGNAAEALRQLRILLGSPSKAEEAAQRSILPMLLRQFRLIWQGRVLLELGMTPYSASESVQQVFPTKPNLIQESNFVQEKAMRSAKHLSYEQVASCVREVADTDARLKGLLPSFSPQETLEQMLLKMIEIVRRERVPVA